MRNPDINKNFKAFNDKIVAKLANNEIHVDTEDPPEGWRLDNTADLNDPYLP